MAMKITVTPECEDEKNTFTQTGHFSFYCKKCDELYFFLTFRGYTPD